MINAGATVDPATLQVVDFGGGVLEQAMASGHVNTADDQILANIRSAIRRGHQQWKPAPPRPERICLIGSGPTLNETLEELRAVAFEGAIIATVNGAYHWAIDHNIRPQIQIVLDARPSNARFVQPAVPRCRYVLASQCAPEVWDAIEGRDNVWIFHAVAGATSPINDLLDTYYHRQWLGVGGGVTVATRAIALLREVGYLRFDLFGIDSCWLEGAHHAFAQPENETDRHITVTVSTPERPDLATRFRCSPWMVKQAEDFLQMIRVNGEHFLLNVHGRGLLAKLLEIGAASVILTDIPKE
jgi:hypothetical protein